MARLDLKIKAMNQASDEIKKIEKDLDKLGDKTVGVGGTMTAGLTAPAAALGTMGGSVAASFEDAGLNIRKELGVTGKELEKLEGMSKDVWLDGWGQDLNDVTSKVGSVKRAMQDLEGTDLKNAVTDTFLISEAYQEEADRVASVGNTLRKTFDEDISDVNDMIYKFYQSGGNMLGDGLDVLSEYSVQFDEMGFSLEETMAVFANAQEDGVWSLDKVGDAVKENFNRMSKMTDEQKTMVGNLGLSYKDMESNINAGGDKAQASFGKLLGSLGAVKNETERNRIGAELFGTQWEDVGERIVLGLDEAKEKGLGNFKGGLDAVKEAQDETFGDTWKETVRLAQDVLLPIGQEVLELANVMMKDAQPVLEDFADTLEGMSPVTKRVIGFFGLFLTVLGPIIAVVGNVIGLISKLTGSKAMGGLINVMSKAWPLLKVGGKRLIALLGPVGAVIGIVWALIDVFKLLYNNWDEITQFGKDAWSGFVDFIKNIFSPIGDFFGNIMEGIKDVFKNGFGSLGDFAKAPLNFIIDLINKVIEGLNQINFDVPDWVPEWMPGVEDGSFGVNIPKVPRLHQGGIFRTMNPGGEGLALLKDGERVYNPNAGGNQDPDAGGSRSNGNGYATINLFLNGEVLARVVGQELSDEMNINLG